MTGLFDRQLRVIPRKQQIVVSNNNKVFDHDPESLKIK